MDSRTNHVLISIISPSYRCAENLPELCRRLHQALGSLTAEYEIILINDASPEHDWEVIEQLAEADSRVRGIKLSRNFGQHYAITAGLDYARGDWVVVMDCDLQDQPEEILKFYHKAQEGYDMVVGRRTVRQHHFFRKLLSVAFYKVFGYLSGVKVDPGISSFGIYSAKVINAIKQLRDQNRSFGLAALWVGFRRAEIDIVHAPRTIGTSSYTFAKMATLALDSAIAHSDKLLRLTVLIGMVISLLSLMYAFWIVMRYFLWAVPVAGWSSLMVSIYFTSGLIIGSVGIVGLYIAKIFEEVKQRPLYLVDKTTFD